jgi:hypothetical protein
VPSSYNVQATCRAVAAVPEARIFDDGGPDATKRCAEEENQARDQLLKEWSQFKVADRAMCVGVSSQGEVDPAYTELETCLEMAQDNDGGGTSTSYAQGAMESLAPTLNSPNGSHASSVIRGMQSAKYSARR